MKLRPYQETGRDFLASRNHALLADEMRVGKTPQAILAAESIGAERVLVLCPAIAVEQWVQEWARWAGVQAHAYANGFPDPVAGVYISSYARASMHVEALRYHEWDVVIADEAHAAKNPYAARTKLVYGKDGVGAAARRLWALSGTPAPRHAGELWPMLRAFGVTPLDYKDFLVRYCIYDPILDCVHGTKAAAIPELRELLALIMLRRTKREVAPDMAPIEFGFLEVAPQDEADLNCMAGVPVGEIEERAKAAEFDKHISEERIAVATAKVPALAEEIIAAIESGLYRKTVVFGHYLGPMRALVRRLQGAGITAVQLYGASTPAERQQFQHDFQNGNLQVLCANIQTAGTAIDLSAASHGYFLELDWVPGNNLQAANRLVSLAKNEPVTIDVVTWPGSYDDRVQRVLVNRVKQLSLLY